MQPKPKIRVGLTGIFGSGKSTVSEMFRELGAKVIDADQLAREALEPGNPPYETLVSQWGWEFLDDQGEVDRKKVADRIFSDSAKRRELEAWIHPYVFERMEEEKKQGPEAVVVFNVPLLFESGWDRHCDWTLAVHASPAMIETRLKARGVSPEEIRRRTVVQIPLEEKMKRAHFVIHNDLPLEEVRKEVLKIWTDLSSPSKGNPPISERI